MKLLHTTRTLSVEPATWENFLNHAKGKIHIFLGFCGKAINNILPVTWIWDFMFVNRSTHGQKANNFNDKWHAEEKNQPVITWFRFALLCKKKKTAARQESGVWYSTHTSWEEDGRITVGTNIDYLSMEISLCLIILSKWADFQLNLSSALAERWICFKVVVK